MVAQDRQTPILADLDATEGLVFAYSFDHDGLRTKADSDTAWEWRSYSLSDSRARRRIENDERLPEPVRTGLLAPDTGLWIEFDEGWLHGEVEDQYHPHYDESRELGQFRFAFDGRLLISGRRRPLQTVEDVRRMVEGGKRPFKSPADLIEIILNHFFDRLAAELSSLAQELDRVEDGIVGENWHRERSRLPPARRRVIFIHRHVTALAHLFRHVELTHHEVLPAELADMVARLAHRTVALHHESEQLQARARMLQEELMEQLSAESNRLLYFLSVMTAVLLPMTIISGLFGMNVGGLPFLHDPEGFWLLTILSFVVAGLVLAFVVRSSRR